MEKLEWLGYLMANKFEDIFIRFDATHERDGQTHRQTDRDRMTHRWRLCIASLSKSRVYLRYGAR